MGQPYVGEVRMFAGNFAPREWALCAGQLLSISDYETLFQLIGTTYGGDGRTTFGLPDLRGRVPIHMGQGPGGETYQLGGKAGTEAETLTTGELPTHSHPQMGSSDSASQTAPAQTVFATTTVDIYVPTANTALAGNAVGSSGGNQPHENRAPFLAVNFIISLFGIFPSPT